MNITSVKKKKIQHTIMKVHRKWYQFINPWLGIIDENFTEEKVFQCALKGE